jgi:hypothetical protein
MRRRYLNCTPFLLCCCRKGSSHLRHASSLCSPNLQRCQMPLSQQASGGISTRMSRDYGQEEGDVCVEKATRLSLSQSSQSFRRDQNRVPYAAGEHTAHRRLPATISGGTEKLTDTHQYLIHTFAGVSPAGHRRGPCHRAFDSWRREASDLAFRDRAAAVIRRAS